MPTRLTARWLLPVSDDPIADAALLVGDDGRIADAGPDHAVPTPPGVREIRLGEAALLPGLVNVHAHPELTAMRGLLEDLPFHEWIPALLRAKINARLDGDDYLDCARYGCLEALRAGITTIGATEDSGASLDALIALGMRGVVYREVFGPSPVRADAAMAQLRDNVDAMCERATDLVRVGISPHAPYTVSDRLYVLATELARAERLPVAVHAAESQAEHLLVTHGLGPFADALGRRGVSTPPRAPSTIALLDRLGVLDTRPLLIHCVRLSTDDVSRIAAAGAPVAHCPTANARLGHGIAPVTEMHEAGITVALGTDSVASNNRMDLLEEGRVAQVLQRARLAAPAALPAATLLRMATLDGARALGLDARIGSLERGKDADLCAVAFDAPSVAPVNDPLAALFHSARASDVVLTMVRGRILYDRAATATAPPSDRALAERIGAIASRLRHALRSPASGSESAVGSPDPGPGTEGGKADRGRRTGGVGGSGALETRNPQPETRNQ